MRRLVHEKKGGTLERHLKDVERGMGKLVGMSGIRKVKDGGAVGEEITRREGVEAGTTKG